MVNGNKKLQNIVLLTAGILAAFILVQMEMFQIAVGEIQKIRYLDAFIGGVLYTLTFSLAIGALVLVAAAGNIEPVYVAFFGALGALLTDVLIFRFVKDSLGAQAKNICLDTNRGYAGRLFCHHYFRWTLPVIGAIIIASPLPDELGVSLMGLANMSSYKFALLSFMLNFLGILVLVSAVKVIF